MLKKAGIVVAAAAVGLLAVSPLAFAGEGDKGHDHHGATGRRRRLGLDQKDSQGLINVSDINANVTVHRPRSATRSTGLVPVGVDNINALSRVPLALLGHADDTADDPQQLGAAHQDNVGGDVTAADED